jgi:glycosyltransferase involved in cell wall biosynthesis
LAQYRKADLFVLACRIAAGGDRDGLPNVLLEAQSQGLACLSTTVDGVLELIDAGRTGLLEPPGDVAALAAGLERLVREPALRAALGAAGAERVRQSFDSAPGIARLAAKFSREASAVVPREPSVAAAETSLAAGSGRPRSCASPSMRR